MKSSMHAIGSKPSPPTSTAVYAVLVPGIPGMMFSPGKLAPSLINAPDHNAAGVTVHVFTR